MDLPANIEVQIIDYLNLEFGAYEESRKVTSDELNYVGVNTLDGKKVWYWKFPCSEKDGCWATVEEYEGSYMIEMTTKKPEIK